MLSTLHKHHAIHLLGAFGLVAWAWLACASHRPGSLPLPGFLLVMGIAWVATLVAWRLARHVPAGRLLPILWIWAVLYRAAGMLAQPVLEDDYYRYLWDGHQFSSTGNPYRSTPADSFTDPAVPEKFQAILDGVNYPQLPTIYGPVCQWAFRLSHRLAPGELWPWKLIVTAADLLTLALLLRLTSPADALLYAWCPLLIKETAFTGHPESLGVLFLVIALCGIRAAKMGSAALALAFAAGVKITGGLLAPFLLWRSGWRPWGWMAAGILVLYGPFWVQGSSGGLAVFSTFARDWEFNSSVYGLLAALTSARIAHIGCGLMLVGWYAWLLNRTPPTAATLGYAVYGGLFLLSPVVNPWYLLWLLPFVTLRPSPVGITALVAVSLSYVCGLYLGDPSLGPYDHPAWVRPVEYGAITLAAAVAWGYNRLKCFGFEPKSLLMGAFPLSR
jgi:alpha-1,6-mannosyltransferase